ncbi:hypothetical protein [Actinoplanes sp. NPDC051494]|uniref:hypothetical protein n=1 Tax=Actinoplanes sp. NPDC051494 TaxID=3363907 RepID=UPI0037B1072A
MPKREYSHGTTSKGRPKVVETTQPRHRRGYDPEYDVVTFTEGPIARLFGRKR